MRDDHLTRFVHRDQDADVLVVTNMWPDDERPVYGIFVKRQVDAMRARGIRCDVVYLRGFSSRYAYPKAILRFAAATLRWRGRYRLVHVHAGETALAARFFVGPPMLVSYCGDDVLGDPREDGSIPAASRLRAFVIREHARFVTATITKTREMHERLPQSVQRGNTVLPNGVDTELFQPMARDEARARLGWPPDESVALFAATKPDIPRKRRNLAERACAEASTFLGKPVRLHVSGLTPPEEMPLVMSAADCLLHTASLEGSPNVVKEALMCNLPIVATPSGDIEALLEGVAVSHVCAADAKTLGAAVAEVVQHGGRSNGRECVQAHLGAGAVATQLLAIYRRLTASSPLTLLTAEQS
jgi:glycosyltransferase involved in cell wall biosynthesis